MADALGEVVFGATAVDGTLDVPPEGTAVVDAAGGAGGAFTVNWVPVSTVTSAPSVTWLGS